MTFCVSFQTPVPTHTDRMLTLLPRAPKSRQDRVAANSSKMLAYIRLPSQSAEYVLLVGSIEKSRP
jgi:hypothetical protein